MAGPLPGHFDSCDRKHSSDDPLNPAPVPPDQSAAPLLRQCNAPRQCLEGSEKHLMNLRFIPLAASARAGTLFSGSALAQRQLQPRPVWELHRLSPRAIDAD
jgi:hypothetical protein